MKKGWKFLAAALTGALAGASIYKITGKRQKKAQKTGRHIPYGPYEAAINRPLDCILATGAVLLLSPVILVTGVLVRLKLGSPVLFTQERPGLDGKLFKLYKFRTMTDKRNAEGELLPDEERLTPFGQKLRSTSLDELPELINIMKGDMAIVGPRPLLAEYMPLYTKRQAKRHEVRPGLTGLAQVSGRNERSWEDRFEDDLRYVEHVSLILDWKIIGKTLGVVLRHEGISSNTSATMEKFTG